MVPTTKNFPYWPENTASNYSFLNPEINTIQFYNREAIAPFFKKLETASDKTVNILYIGDSHVQADFFTGELRDRLQQAFGYGGRGMVFPYSTARTHAAVDYTTKNTGKWLYSKNVEQYPELPMGVSGATSKTFDSAATFSLNFRYGIRPEFTKLKIFCKKGPQSYHLKLHTISDDIEINPNDDPNPNCVTVNLTVGESDLTFSMHKTDSLQTEFEIYGISIESNKPGGVLMHSVGINGAGHYSLLRQSLTEPQMKEIAPDLIVLDIGANDFYRNGISKSSFIYNLQTLITRYKTWAPNCNIVLSCSQDIYRGGYSIPDCGIFSEIIKDVAYDNKVAFYDWYWIAGGRFSMRSWYSNSLSKWDMVHLTNTGYKLKGALICEGFQRTYDFLKTNDTAKKLIYDIDTLINPPVDTAKLRREEEERKRIASLTPTITYKWIYHRVTRGQNIWGIAAYYGVTGYQIKVWNGLRSYYLGIGQVLKIYAPIKTYSSNPAPQVTTPAPPAVTPTPTPKPTPKPTTAPKPVVVAPKPTTPKPAPAKPYVAPKPVYYSVKRGETLYQIAARYGTTVDALKRLNKLKSNSLLIGQRLRVK